VARTTHRAHPKPDRVEAASIARVDNLLGVDRASASRAASRCEAYGRGEQNDFGV